MEVQVKSKTLDKPQTSEGSELYLCGYSLPKHYLSTISNVVGVSNFSLGVSGLVILLQEYNEVPDCAKNYKPWMSTVIIFYCCVCWLYFGRLGRVLEEMCSGPRFYYVLLTIISLLGILIGTGFNLRHRTDSECKTNKIAAIQQWTDVTLVYSSCIFILLSSVIIDQYFHISG